MRVRLRPQAIRVFQIFTAIFAAVLLVYFTGASQTSIVQAEGGSGQCDQQYNACVQARRSDCEQQWQTCMRKCNAGGGAVGACSQDPECQLHCTESATSQGGRISCCDGGPKHQNSCPNKVDGNCSPRKTNAQTGGPQPGEGGQKPGGEGQGQSPQMPQMPSGGGGGSGSQPPPTGTGECERNGSSSDCTNQGGSGLLSSWFTSGTDTTGSTQQSAMSSITDQLLSFITGDSSAESVEDQNGALDQDEGAGQTSGTNALFGNLQSVVTTWLAPSSASQPDGSADNSPGDAGRPVGQVTGFGASGGVQTNASGGIFDAIGQTLSGIGILLQNMLSSIF